MFMYIYIYIYILLLSSIVIIIIVLYSIISYYIILYYIIEGVRGRPLQRPRPARLHGARETVLQSFHFTVFSTFQRNFS